MNRLWLFLVMLLPACNALAVKLSDNARMSLITCAPGDMIYDCFGHSAIRVYDADHGIDWVYNYGIYNFSQPNFELNFAKGYLEYKLGKGYFKRFVPIYTRDERTITELVLDLTPEQRQKVFDFLEWNALPENQNYFYDYFEDNCATRVRDVFDQELAIDLCAEFNTAGDEGMSFRDMVHQYAHNNKWSALGIDLCLGVKIDRELEPCEYVFLPDYLHNLLEQFEWNGRALVKEEGIIYAGTPRLSTPFLKGPLFWFWLVSALLMLVLIKGNKGVKKAIDMTLFGLSAFIGLFLLSLWLFTDHQTTAWNFNLLWAQPLLIIALFLPKRLKVYFFKYWSLTLGAMILLWLLLPQELNWAFFPVILLLAYRAYSHSTQLQAEVL